MLNGTLPTINPFLVNPVKARMKSTGECVGVMNVLKVFEGLLCAVEHPCGKMSMVGDFEIEALEPARWEELKAAAV